MPKLKYVVLHLCRILACWLYRLYILLAHRFLYYFCSPGTKAYLDHEYKVVTRDNETLFTRLRNLYDFSDSSMTFSRLCAERTDTPSAAFLRIVHNVHLLPTSKHLNVSLNDEIQNFWYRGITGASKPDHFLFGGKWHIKDLPDPREKLGNDPLLCAIAASTAEQMVEAFNWRTALGIRRDLGLLRVRKPYWDKNLVPCMMESAPKWCEDVGPVKVQTVVDQDKVIGMVKSKTNDLSPSFKKRNLLASLQFLYFA